MKTIAFYISDYGYGHAARSLAVVRELLKQKDDVRCIILHSFALSFLKESLYEYSDRITYISVETDVGYVLKPQSLELDAEALANRCQSYLQQLPKRVSEDATLLRELGVKAVLSDISPLAFAVAEELGVPSIGLSNFTWHKAYENVLPEATLQQFRTLYEKMGYFYQLAGANEGISGRLGTRTFGFYSRQVDEREIERIRREVNPEGDKKIVFMPIGMRIELGDLSQLPIWNSSSCTFIVSSNMNIQHPNVHHIPAAYTESQNYTAAADIVISKAGWGTVAEAVNNGKPLLLINREGMSEDQNTITYLIERNLCRVIDWADLSSISIESYIREVTVQENECRRLVSSIIQDLTI